MRNRFMAYEVYEEFYGHAMSRAQWDELVLWSSMMQLFRKTMFKRIIPNLKRIGLLSDRVRPLYERAGLLGYEHGKARDSDLSAKDFSTSRLEVGLHYLRVDAGDRRIEVHQATRAVVGDQPHDVTVIGLSARTALLLSPTELAPVGKSLGLFLPTVKGSEIELLVGVDNIDQLADGWVMEVTFIVVEQSVRTALNDLMALLLSGSGGGQRKHPRIIYDVTVRHGPELAQVGKLEEIRSAAWRCACPSASPPARRCTSRSPTTARRCRWSSTVASCSSARPKRAAITPAWPSDRSTPSCARG